MDSRAGSSESAACKGLAGVPPLPTTAIKVPRVDAWLLVQYGILGFVALAPWNFVLTAVAFLDSKFHHNFASSVPIIYSASVNIAQLIMVWVGNKFTFAPRFDLGCVMLSIAITLLAVVAIIFGDGDLVSNAGLGFGLALICVFFLGFGHSIMESSAFGLAALCPKICMVATMVGEGVGGLAPWPCQLLIEVIFSAVPNSQGWQTLIFFVVPAAVSLLIIPMFRLWTAKHPYMVEVLRIEEKRKHDALATRQTRRPVHLIIREVLPMALCAWGGLAVLFVVFPAQVVLWTSSNPNNNGFVPQIIYTFQVLDTVGRFAPSVGLSLSERMLMLFITLRVLFIPLFICTTLYQSIAPFSFDWFKHIEMALMAVTNGFGVTLAMAYGPQRVSQDKAEQEVAGYTMGFALINGIFVGSLFGLLANVCLGQT
ncbi:transporter [Perkinsus olseni]|uniref:Transporter n=1 Tax=Perkinsus olseni TaxID=32597 RepID=A0A7J6PTF2_PEROL|nr:transporter [Perkinsus olseni]